MMVIWILIAVLAGLLLAFVVALVGAWRALRRDFHEYIGENYRSQANTANSKAYSAAMSAASCATLPEPSQSKECR